MPRLRETWISALLIVPALVLYALPPYGHAGWVTHWLTMRLPAELYLLVVVAAWGRSLRRRVVAAIIVAMGIVVDRGVLLSHYLGAGQTFSAIDHFTNLNRLVAGGSIEYEEARHYSGLDNATGWFGAAYSAMVFFVIAWGVARRRNPLWVLGIPVSVVILVGSWRLLYDSHAIWLEGPWLANRLAGIGVFVVCCLTCWTFDGLWAAVRSRRRDTPMMAEAERAAAWTALAWASVGVVAACAVGLVVTWPPAPTPPSPCSPMYVSCR